jgi:hypothetical protein
MSRVTRILDGVVERMEDARTIVRRIVGGPQPDDATRVLADLLPIFRRYALLHVTEPGEARLTARLLLLALVARAEDATRGVRPRDVFAEDGAAYPLDACVACYAESILGTEEVPHPVDDRVHTCKERHDAP